MNAPKPTYDQVAKAIDRLSAISVDDENAYEKAFLAYLSIGSLFIFTANLVKGQIIFRARTNDEYKNWTSFSQIDCPESKYVKKFARCNRPSQRMFYGAENPQTAYMELVASWAEEFPLGATFDVTISVWQLEQSCPVVFVPIPDISKRRGRIEIQFGKIYDDTIQGMDAEVVRAGNLFFNYLGGKFQEPYKPGSMTYIITSAYTSLALSQIPTSDFYVRGIVYPSVPYEGHGGNFALEPKFAKDNLSLLRVFKHSFNVKPGSHGLYEFEQFSNAEAKLDLGMGTINW